MVSSTWNILRAQEAYVCMSAGKYRVHRFRHVTRRLVPEMQKLLHDFKTIDAGMPWLSYPFAFHNGAHGFTSDACAPGSVAKTPGGWGICVFGLCAYGSAKTVKAFDDGDISISPMELILAAAVIAVGFDSKKLKNVMCLI